jgi:hypothetical protein
MPARKSLGDAAWRGEGGEIGRPEKKLRLA